MLNVFLKMLNYILSHLCSIGLVFDIIGVSILFFVVVTMGEQVILIDEDENKTRLRKKKKKECVLKIGYFLIFLGFLLQFIYNEMNNSTLNEIINKVKIINSP